MLLFLEKYFKLNILIKVRLHVVILLSPVHACTYVDSVQYKLQVTLDFPGTCPRTLNHLNWFYAWYYSDAPIAESDQEVRKGSALNKDVVLEVHTCANPSDQSYEWRFNGTDLRPGIEGGDSSSMTITQVKQEDFGEYTCTVSNEINGDQRSTDIKIELLPLSEY